MLVVFIVAAGSVMARGIDVENCGCVSLAKAGAPTAWPPAWMKGVGWFLVSRNLVLLAASLVLVLAAPSRRGSGSHTETARQRAAERAGLTPASGAGGQGGATQRPSAQGKT